MKYFLISVAHGTVFAQTLIVESHPSSYAMRIQINSCLLQYKAHWALRSCTIFLQLGTYSVPAVERDRESIVVTRGCVDKYHLCGTDTCMNLDTLRRGIYMEAPEEKYNTNETQCLSLLFGSEWLTCMDGRWNRERKVLMAT